MDSKHWRSLLFIPQYAYPKAKKIGADCYLADLQDSIPLPIKEAARQGIIEACRKKVFYNLNLIVRINELAEEKEFKRDIESMVGLPDVLGFMLTMIETAEEVSTIHQIVSEEEKKKGIQQGTYRFLILVETPAAIFNAFEIAKAGGGRNIGMLLGSGDLFRLTRAETSVKLTLDFPRNDVVFACRAAGIEPFDTPFTGITDKIGLELSCESGKKHGFTGKAAIHSDHIRTINRIFIPEPHKIEQARRILAAQREGKLSILQNKTKWKNSDKKARKTDGMGVLGGKLIGPPHIKDSQYILAQAKALVPKVRPGIKGEVAKHVVDYKMRPGDVLPNPFEITITESLLSLWHYTFYSHDRSVTSVAFAQKLGLTTTAQMPIPFMMGLYLTVCMNDTHEAVFHLGFRNARQHAPVTAGMTVRQRIIVKNIKSTANKKNSIITTRRELIDVSNGKILFTVEKLELYPFLNYDFSENGSAAKTEKTYKASSSFFRSTILTKCGEDKSVIPEKQNVLPLEKGRLILHTFTRPMGVDSNLALSTIFKVTHPIHIDHHMYDPEDTRGIIVSGGLAQALTVAAASRDLHEVVWEELIQGDNIAPLGPKDTLGAISYIVDRKISEASILHEELIVRTFGLKNISPAIECIHSEFPPELFSGPHRKPSEYNTILHRAGAYWLEERLVTVITRKIVRLLPINKIAEPSRERRQKVNSSATHKNNKSEKVYVKKL